MTKIMKAYLVVKKGSDSKPFIYENGQYLLFGDKEKAEGEIKENNIKNTEIMEVTLWQREGVIG